MRHVMRLLLVFSTLIVLAGCDSGREAVDDVLIVSLGEAPNDGPGLQLQTEGDHPCGARLVVSEETDGAVLRVEVGGSDLSGTGCEAADAPLYWSTYLPVPNPTVDVEVRHRGETDLYRYACGFAGCDFVAVRTSTTRLGPR